MSFSFIRKCLLSGVLLLCGLQSDALAQWQTTTYNLKGGWNAIYLTGDVKHGSLDALLPVSVQEVWRWNPNPQQVQFTESPLIPSAATPEWSVWRRGIPADSNLSEMIGQTSYLVKCTGSASTSHTVAIKQAIIPPAATWVRAGANLLGFPSFKNGSNFPLFSNYFASFPSAIAANTKIFKYVGGDLGSGNPLQIFAPTTERVDRTQAYWFSSEVVGNFYGPMEITTDNLKGIAFGKTESIIKVLVRNRSASAITLTIAPLNSEAAPAGSTAVTGPVPVTRRLFNATTATWTETAITASYTEAIAPQTTIELSFGVNRALMTGPAGSNYASFLRFTESSNLMEVLLPVSASKASLAGLWIGDVTLTNVSSQVVKPAFGSAKLAVQGTAGLVASISVNGNGGAGYSVAPVVTIDAPPAGGTQATATATVVGGVVTGFTMTNAGSGYIDTPQVTVAAPPPLSGTTVPRTFTMRTLVHVDDGGTARLLSQVYIGRLAVAPHPVGLCTRESQLHPDYKASAQRLTTTSLPLDQVIETGSGSVAMPGQLTRTFMIPFTDPTNPFIHQYHPDHDNLNARFNAPQRESYDITRSCQFTFTTVPPVDNVSGTGWGASVIGGYYQETISGLHRKPLQVSGYFELRRASELGSITVP
jgi:hypothetical protein